MSMQMQAQPVAKDDESAAATAPLESFDALKRHFELHTTPRQNWRRLSTVTANKGGKGGKGWLYAVLLDNGLIKVGRSKKGAFERVKTYNITSSLPLFPFHEEHVENMVIAEAHVHTLLHRCQYKGGKNRELYDCTQQEVVRAMVKAKNDTNQESLYTQVDASIHSSNDRRVAVNFSAIVSTTKPNVDMPSIGGRTLMEGMLVIKETHENNGTNVFRILVSFKRQTCQTELVSRLRGCDIHVHEQTIRVPGVGKNASDLYDTLYVEGDMHGCGTFVQGSLPFTVVECNRYKYLYQRAMQKLGEKDIVIEQLRRPNDMAVD